MCSDICYFFSNLLKKEGYHSELWDIGNNDHSVMQVYNDNLKKYIFLDIDNGCIILNKTGIPLSIDEIKKNKFIFVKKLIDKKFMKMGYENNFNKLEKDFIWKPDIMNNKSIVKNSLFNNSYLKNIKKYIEYNAVKHY